MKIRAHAPMLVSILIVLAFMAAAPANTRAQSKVIFEGPQDLKQISSIGELLLSTKQRPVHILYVHGIGATGPGDSQIFQRNLCVYLNCGKLPKTLVPQGRDYADGGVFAEGPDIPHFLYMGNPVWTTQLEWQASAPFVDHYLLPRSGGAPVVVDEINWWPLVNPLKCKYMMTQEARLAGPNKMLLDLCSQSKGDIDHPGRYISYEWIKSEDARALESVRPKGARLNRSLKTNLLDWGFSDAMMAAGDMHDMFREGIRQLLVKSARFHADGSKTDDWEQQERNPQQVDREFVVVSHSLGSYLVFSTLNVEQQVADPQGTPGLSSGDVATAREDAASRYILQRTSLVYFFANQIPLLELANVERTKTAQVLGSRIQSWGILRENFRKDHAGETEAPVNPPQLVAWSDPSDLLTWCIPDMKPLTIVNLYVRNTWWRWLIANPLGAHANYASNKRVLRTMMSTKPSEARGEVCR